MLFQRKHIDGIKAGNISLAFRRWTRPSVKTGGTQLTQVGLLTIKEVKAVSLSSITAKDAKLAGFDSLTNLKNELQKRSGGKIYRIELGKLTEGPRTALRNLKPSKLEIENLVEKLARMDKRSAVPWTQGYLELIRDNEAVRAADLCGQLGFDKPAFKLNVRKLKALGLTESLGVGYRIAPRGLALLKAINKK
ncbi:MAG: hypothetical protein GKR91_03645 [Pseudomonadales bacterium]|nr:hypothetical protein [Pseudomonadales bacterium]